jgi:hypothetical protein
MYLAESTNQGGWEGPQATKEEQLAGNDPHAQVFEQLIVPNGSVRHRNGS